MRGSTEQGRTQKNALFGHQLEQTNGLPLRALHTHQQQLQGRQPLPPSAKIVLQLLLKPPDTDYLSSTMHYPRRCGESITKECRESSYLGANHQASTSMGNKYLKTSRATKSLKPTVRTIQKLWLHLSSAENNKEILPWHSKSRPNPPCLFAHWLTGTWQKKCPVSQKCPCGQTKWHQRSFRSPGCTEPWLNDTFSLAIPWFLWQSQSPHTIKFLSPFFLPGHRSKRCWFPEQRDGGHLCWDRGKVFSCSTTSPHAL